MNLGVAEELMKNIIGTSKAYSDILKATGQISALMPKAAYGISPSGS